MVNKAKAICYFLVLVFAIPTLALACTLDALGTFFVALMELWGDIRDKWSGKEVDYTKV